jgi:hypothetical protein
MLRPQYILEQSSVNLDVTRIFGKTNRMINIIGNYIGQTQGGSEPLIPSELQDKFSVLWLGSVVGDNLIDIISGQNIVITGKDFVTTYIPPTSTATFSLPNVAGLKTDDNFDGAWYTDAGAVKQIPVSYFINNDYSRTLVKYANEAPYNVEWIGLLKNDATISSEELDLLHEYFQLHYFWTGVFNDSGVMKDNRGMAGLGYKGWIAKCEIDLGFTGLADTVKASINKYVLDLINEGILVLTDREFMWMLNNGTLVPTYGTVSLANYDSTRGTFHNSPTFTASGTEANGSTQYFRSQFNATVGTNNYTQNSAHVSLYRYKAKTIATSYNFGFISFATVVMTNGASSSLHRLNTTTNGPGLNMNTLDYQAIDRNAASGVGSNSIYVGTTKTDFNTTSTALSNEDLVVFRAVFGFGDDGFSMWSQGGHLTQTQHTAKRAAFLAHKTRLGL